MIILRIQIQNLTKLRIGSPRENSTKEPTEVLRNKISSSKIVNRMYRTYVFSKNLCTSYIPLLACLSLSVIFWGTCILLHLQTYGILWKEIFFILYSPVLVKIFWMAILSSAKYLNIKIFFEKSVYRFKYCDFNICVKSFHFWTELFGITTKLAWVVSFMHIEKCYNKQFIWNLLL